MMKLSHESKLRLGVGIGAFVLIIGLVFGISRTLIHFEGPWDFGTATLDWPGRDSGNYSAQPQKLSSETFDADSFQSLDLDVTSSTVEIKHVSGGPVRVIESGRVAKGASASDAATRNLAEVKGSTLKISQYDCDDERAINRTVTIELPREVAENMVGITASVESTGAVTDTLSAEVGLGDVTFDLNQAPAKSMDVTVGSGDAEITVPNSTGFKASLTLGCGDFESDFLPDGYDGEMVSNLEFDNGDKSAAYRFEVGAGDMSFDSE